MAAGDTIEFRATFKEIGKVRPGHEIELTFSVPNTIDMKSQLSKVNMTNGANILCVEDEEQLDLPEGEEAE